MLVIRSVENEAAGHAVDAPGAPASHSVTLPFDKRRGCRQRVILDGGGEAALFLPRGTVLEPGGVLVAEDGTRVLVRAAIESLSRATTANPTLLTRAAYHLGNRHVAVQVEAGTLSYLHDHVLDELVRGLGLHVEAVEAPFQPEGGAYSKGHDH